MLRHLRATDAMRNFSEFRQEASMLHALQHPCIVSLIGISIHPLCFALELAPLGSLNTVLSENARGKRCTWNLPPGAHGGQHRAPGASQGRAQLPESRVPCPVETGAFLQASVPGSAVGTAGGVAAWSQTEPCSESRFSAIIWEFASFTHPSKEVIAPLGGQ